MNLTSCANVTMSGVYQFKRLRVLNLSSSGVVGDSLTTALEACDALEELLVDDCMMMSSVKLSLGGMKVGIACCVYIGNLHLETFIESLLITCDSGAGQGQIDLARVQAYTYTG